MKLPASKPYVAPLTASLTLLFAIISTPAPALATHQAIEEKRLQQWHLQYLSVREAHRISKGQGVTVAVLDTGVYPHAELKQNLLPGTDFTEKGGSGLQDVDGHGTAMAGLIAARGRDSAVGIAPYATVLPIKFKDDSSEGTADGLAQSVIYAVQSGVEVISISAGGEQDIAEQEAVQAALDADIIVVAAAGNRPRDQTVRYPAAYPGVIAVGGIDKKGNQADVSVTGDRIDVVAPAVELVSTNFDGGYRVGTGTSGAAAIVAGAAALVRAKYPYLPADEVAHRLTATAIDKGPPGRDDQYGYGVIDLVAALTADVPPRGFGSVPADAPDTAGPSTAAADGPPADEGRAATVRGLVTLGVLVAAGGAWALVARHRRRSDDPPPRITR
ncbi:type VII secretion-associated serine protease mycosin [Verrucosispora sp. WMMA2044]|uniref:type VII secretion-associated serine protease mycosin n=1 Tax=Verrucosispora sp. WMMA2044 TaxID=3016419 RepID=UPI00248ADAF5|nr:type VII secretion-associated serine protease mycosin [Verrucosispora sp. WMMA2044]WBB47631.1 type VII secretion-associated serine protease mycosin [Verrucosispora sp. WMMA2044]